MSFSELLEGSIGTVETEAAAQTSYRQQTRALRMIASKQQKFRATVQSEEQNEFDEIIRMEGAYRQSILTYEAFKRHYENEKKHKAQLVSSWSTWKVSEELLGLVEEEVRCRHQLCLREIRLRATMRKLREIEYSHLHWQHERNKIIYAEMVRRVTLYRHEVEAAMSLNILGYDPHLLPVEGISDAKLDWMKNVRCPFVCAEDCPFFPERVKQSLKAASRFPVRLPASPSSSAGKQSARISDGKCVATLSFSASRSSHANSLDRNMGSIMAARLSRKNRIALKSVLNQGHYKSSKCSFLPQL